MSEDVPAMRIGHWYEIYPVDAHDHPVRSLPEADRFAVEFVRLHSDGSVNSRDLGDGADPPIATFGEAVDAASNHHGSIICQWDRRTRWPLWQSPSYGKEPS